MSASQIINSNPNPTQTPITQNQTLDLYPEIKKVIYMNKNVDEKAKKMILDLKRKIAEKIIEKVLETECDTQICVNDTARKVVSMIVNGVKLIVDVNPRIVEWNIDQLSINGNRIITSGGDVVAKIHYEMVSKYIPPSFVPLKVIIEKIMMRNVEMKRILRQIKEMNENDVRELRKEIAKLKTRITDLEYEKNEILVKLERYRDAVKKLLVELYGDKVPEALVRAVNPDEYVMSLPDEYVNEYDP